MVFNIATHNRDDHARNFSFMMDIRWNVARFSRLRPAVFGGASRRTLDFYHRWVQKNPNSKISLASERNLVFSCRKWQMWFTSLDQLFNSGENWQSWVEFPRLCPKPFPNTFRTSVPQKKEQKTPTLAIMNISVWFHLSSLDSNLSPLTLRFLQTSRAACWLVQPWRPPPPWSGFPCLENGTRQVLSAQDGMPDLNLIGHAMKKSAESKRYEAGFSLSGRKQSSSQSVLFFLLWVAHSPPDKVRWFWEAVDNCWPKSWSLCNHESFDQWEKSWSPQTPSDFSHSWEPLVHFYPSASEGLPKKLRIWERANSRTIWEVRRGGM